MLIFNYHQDATHFGTRLCKAHRAHSKRGADNTCRAAPQLDQLAKTERHRLAMRTAQAAVDRAANTSALMGQVRPFPRETLTLTLTLTLLHHAVSLL